MAFAPFPKVDAGRPPKAPDHRWGQIPFGVTPNVIGTKDLGVDGCGQHGNPSLCHPLYGATVDPGLWTGENRTQKEKGLLYFSRPSSFLFKKFGL